LDSCPEITDEQLGELLIQLSDGQNGNMMFQDEESRSSALNRDYLYLDTCSTEDQMVVPEYLTGIHNVKEGLVLHTNAGKSHTNQKGYLGETAFWLDEHRIAIVISLKTLEKKFHVTYDSTKDGGAFMCDTPAGRISFNRCPITKFPYIDLSQNRSKAATMLVQTIRQNFEGYTQEEVERAIMARKMQGRSGHPSKATFRAEVSRNSHSSLFDKSPISTKDITNARKFFGPSLPCIKGKWT
jgi:hypothetical protein